MICLYQYQHIFRKLRHSIYEELKFKHSFIIENYNRNRH